MSDDEPNQPNEGSEETPGAEPDDVSYPEPDMDTFDGADDTATTLTLEE